MKNYIKSGDILTLIAPAGDVLSGVGYLIGTILGVAQADATAGEDFEAVVKGQFTMDKLTTDVMAAGAKVNWNNTTKEFQNAAGDKDGAAVVVEAAGNGDTEVVVRLLPDS